jgi:hypothetical protein
MRMPAMEAFYVRLPPSLTQSGRAVVGPTRP